MRLEQAGARSRMLSLLSARGMDAIGMGFAGVPGVLIGHNADLAWTVTSGMADVVDTFVEKLEPGNKRRYRFRGEWKQMACRTEPIAVRGAIPAPDEICETVHGPVVGWDEAAHVAHTAVTPGAGHELETQAATLGINRARTIQDFAREIGRVWFSYNFLAATRTGDIGYWHCGRLPLRDPRYDPRLPLPGSGEAEWKGLTTFDQMPHVINPRRGYLINWNNKPAPWFPHGDTAEWGSVSRKRRFEELIEGRPRHTFEQARAILIDISATDPNADYLKPSLLEALQGDAARDPRMRKAADLLAAWENHSEDDNIPKAIFDAWLRHLRMALWGRQMQDILPPADQQRWVQPSVLLHAIRGPASAPAPDGALLTGALNSALSELETAQPDQSRWDYHQRDIDFRPLPGIPLTSRGAYIFLVELSSPRFRAVSVLAPGQSENPASPHFGDQREMAGYWRFKRMAVGPEELSVAGSSAP